MGPFLPKSYNADKARASNLSLFAIITIIIIISCGVYVLDGGFPNFSGNQTVKATLSVTHTGLTTPNEKFSMTISNVSGNLSLSDVRVSITDFYGTSVSQTFNNGTTTDQILKAESNGVIPMYVYDISASGAGGYLTKATIITITVSGGTPTPVSNIALIDTLSGGTISSWSS